ncbi:MAG: hypothetical protein A2X48_04875 [Lentisphaerae bacterium GWF2_49_21]|nr:MAG: hypothetical protein A2X48_04875 [Lentisphaerae bacterium GWF2_49_21]
MEKIEKRENMKKVLIMAMLLGLSVAFMAGCGKKEEPTPGAALDSLIKKAGAVADDAKAKADKAASDGKVAVDKVVAEAKAAADKALAK